MKANEAPERIQLGFVENENHSLKIRGISYLEEKQYGLTEYIRTDAFIEKACSWFRTLDDKEPPYETTEEFIEAFKKAL